MPISLRLRLHIMVQELIVSVRLLELSENL
ncbi:hypothetical protein ABIE61_003779 [Marinobacterium sp. MBR-111]